jgi:competence protein ComEC
LLTKSPKIKLERLIQITNPIEIIADGSNYKNYIDRWRLTCLKNKIPYHYTGEKGAYYYKGLMYIAH